MMKKSQKKGSSGGQPGFAVSFAQRRTIARSLGHILSWSSGGFMMSSSMPMIFV
jgi:hypothetical protein